MILLDQGRLALRDMFEDKCVWSALYPISNHSHIRQLQFATHAFSQQVLQQAVQISICQ